MGSRQEENLDNSGYFDTIEMQVGKAVLQKVLLSGQTTRIIPFDLIVQVIKELRSKESIIQLYAGVEYDVKLVLERGGYKVE